MKMSKVNSKLSTPVKVKKGKPVRSDTAISRKVPAKSNMRQNKKSVKAKTGNKITQSVGKRKEHCAKRKIPDENITQKSTKKRKPDITAQHTKSVLKQYPLRSKEKKESEQITCQAAKATKKIVSKPKAVKSRKESVEKSNNTKKEKKKNERTTVVVKNTKRSASVVKCRKKSESVKMTAKSRKKSKLVKMTAKSRKKSEMTVKSRKKSESIKTTKKSTKPTNSKKGENKNTMLKKEEIQNKFSINPFTSSVAPIHASPFLLPIPTTTMKYSNPNIHAIPLTCTWAPPTPIIMNSMPGPSTNTALLKKDTCLKKKKPIASSKSVSVKTRPRKILKAKRRLPQSSGSPSSTTFLAPNILTPSAQSPIRNSNNGNPSSLAIPLPWSKPTTSSIFTGTKTNMPMYGGFTSGPMNFNPKPSPNIFNPKPSPNIFIGAAQQPLTPKISEDIVEKLKKEISDESRKSFVELHRKVLFENYELTVDDFQRFSVKELKATLKLNDRSANGNKTALAEEIGDYMKNGCPPRCPKCAGGRLRCRSVNGLQEYFCPGYFDDDEKSECDYNSYLVIRNIWINP